MGIAPQQHIAHGISFVARTEHAMIENLLGLLGGELHEYRAMSGLFRLTDESGCYNGRDIEITEFNYDENNVSIAAENEITKITMSFTFKDGVWVRKDCIKNKKSEPSVISGYKSKFLLRGYNFEVFTQVGSWINENQGAWSNVINGGVSVENMGPRTCENAQPFIAIRNTEHGNGVSFDYLPTGKWKIEVKSLFNSTCPCCQIEMGPPENDFRLKLAAGEEVCITEMIIYDFKAGDNSLGSAKLHKYLINNRMHNKELPVYWNSWFFEFDKLDYDKFIKEADAAAELGCEYFVVDAGWFGKGNGWEGHVGTWTECQDGAFFGKMKDLADHVREKGMKFGLWIEPERVCGSSDLYKEHPEFVKNSNGFAGMADFGMHEVRKYFEEVIDGLIEKYGIRFIKFDMNVEGDRDETGSQFFRHYQGYYEFYDMMYKKHPEVYFEFCSSGGLRTDTKNICTADSHFVSDTINPVEGLYLLQGAGMRVPSSMIGKWHATSEVGSLPAPAYGGKRNHLLACGDATWDSTIEVDYSFMEAFMFLGPWGFTSKISDYSDEYKERLKKGVELFKSYREFVRKSVFRTLTPMVSKYDRKGPVLFQLSSVEEDRHLIACFHLEENTITMLAHPFDISDDKKYNVRIIGSDFGTDPQGIVMSGTDINVMGVGIPMRGYKNTGVLMEIKEIKE